jgi:hypothetical protein
MSDYNHVTVGYKRNFSALTYTISIRNVKEPDGDGIPLSSLTPYTLLALEKVCMNFEALPKIFGSLSRGFRRNVEQILITNVNSMSEKKHQALSYTIFG